jgi:hypothetical protein
LYRPRIPASPSIASSTGAVSLPSAGCTIPIGPTAWLFAKNKFLQQDEAWHADDVPDWQQRFLQRISTLKERFAGK